jgi:hypothetical protein
MARVSLTCLLLATFPALAEDRTFAVTIDGQPAGELVIGYHVRSDGNTAVTVRGEYRAERPTLLSFEYRGTESWKDGRLVRLEGFGSANGHKGGITLVSGKDAYALKAGVKEVRVRDEVWPTLSAMRPDPDAKPLVVDVISGDVLHARVEKIGPDRVTVADKPLAVTVYRVVAGPNRWDMAFDDKQRLAKWAWTRDGRTVSTELKQCKDD